MVFLLFKWKYYHKKKCQLLNQQPIPETKLIISVSASQ